MAQALDETTLELTGEVTPVAEGVGGSEGFLMSRSRFSVSDNGVLVYQSGEAATRLGWFDRGGNLLGSVIGPPGDHIHIALSPDERVAAVTRTDTRAGTRDIWLVELSSGTSTRFTFERSDEFYPIWSPDGSRIVFTSDRLGPFSLFEKSVAGGKEELLLQSSTSLFSLDWSSDGKYLLGSATRDGLRLWVMPMTPRADAATMEELPAEHDQRSPQFSADSCFIAYVSNESGRDEIWVQPFPFTGGKWQITTEGGYRPRWRSDGTELFFLATGGKMMVVPISPGERFHSGTPELLFQTDFESIERTYGVSSDGQRFLVAMRDRESAHASLSVVLDWPAALKP